MLLIKRGARDSFVTSVREPSSCVVVFISILSYHPEGLAIQEWIFC